MTTTVPASADAEEEIYKKEGVSMKKTHRILGMLLALTMMTALFAVPVSAEESYPDIEYWFTNEGYLPVEVGGAYYNLTKDTIGVGVYMPYVDWNGGQTYREQLALRVAANDTPDIFIYNGGIENSLILDGAVLDLTDYLPEYMPHVWEAIPSSVWEAVRANDPTGEGRIWMIPDVTNFTRHGAYIRTDWLEKVGMEMPDTQEELVEVLRAFKDKDPNGNGAADEIPTGGRAEARWMDYLFAMYGVAMYEGYPEWDVYDGEITYSAVTPNMKAALGFIASLYKEGLLDPETLLNSSSDWSGKFDSNTVGIYYHIPWVSYQRLQGIYDYTAGEVKATIANLPQISAEGYEGFITVKPTGSSGRMISADVAKDEMLMKAAFRVLDCQYNMEYRDLEYGVEGMHYEVVDGKKVKLPEDKATQELLILQTPGCMVENVEVITSRLEAVRTTDNDWAVDQAIAVLNGNQADGKVVASDGMPSSVYDGYEDIQNRTLYVEYASKIISGEFELDKFDEFVERWYKNGGQAVTDRVREWYAGKQ